MIQSIKKYLLSFFSFIAFSNIFIAFCAVSITTATLQILRSSSVYYINLVFCATWLIYSLYGYLSKRDNLFHGEALSKATWIKKNKNTLLVCCIIAIMGITYFSFQLKIKTSPWIILSSIATFLYVLPKNKWINIRQWPFMKIFIISGIWTIITAILPLKYSGQDLLTPFSLSLVLNRFLFIFAIVIPFDIRDIEHDKNSQLVTFPIALGIQKSKILAYIIIILHLIFSYFNHSLFIPAIIISIPSIILIFHSDEYKTDLYYLLGIDGLIILYSLLLNYTSFTLI